jgi:hypothetical protein
LVTCRPFVGYHRSERAVQALAVTAQLRERINPSGDGTLECRDVSGEDIRAIHQHWIRM